MILETQLTPAYLVYGDDNTGTYIQRLFFDNNLLNARRAAVGLAETLFNNPNPYVEGQPIEVYLVETYPDLEKEPIRITRILRSSVPTDEDLEERTLDAKIRNKEYSTECLLALDKEYDYYVKHNIQLGFGSFELKVKLWDQPKSQTTINVLFEAAGYALAMIGRFKWELGHKFSANYTPYLALPTEQVEGESHYTNG
ncbi:hypothetical protein M0L20_29535 [Spirosoma sp. RP8]|uniref:Uncharacterized protein n=1 Tax=Spirosoma liriopis TaxID=2937440 RepID=A0ABT0HVP8_9BACT|nr:hypothetical protein [Spirosoma liriopis]MCK8496045.1 hypothetical protein [Spirosoma liriopis]